MQQAQIPYLISSGSVPIRKPTVLLVDDDRIIRMMLQEMLTQYGYDIYVIADARDALEMLHLKRGDIDAVIVDREMPEMDGMELVRQMKSDELLSVIPIVMLTATSEQRKIQEGIEAGVYHYLIKPIENTLLRSILDSVLREYQQVRDLKNELAAFSTCLRALHSCQLKIQTLSQAENTASLLANSYPEPERVFSGLLELLVNAVEHGNLGVSYAEKSELLQENRWRDELQHRALLPENAGKYAEVIYKLTPKAHIVQITDCGSGFDWKKYLQIDPARAAQSHGRGIARAKLMSFDRVAYNVKGNQVTAWVQLKTDKEGALSW